MFGLGTWEILLILVAALVFIGPDKLPKVAKTIGKGMRQVRSAMSDVDHEVRRAGNDFLNAAEAAADADEEPDEAPAAASRPAEPPPTAPPEPEPGPKTDAEWREHLRQPIEGRVASAPPTRRKPHGSAPAAPESTEDADEVEPRSEES